MAHASVILHIYSFSTMFSYHLKLIKFKLLVVSGCYISMGFALGKLVSFEVPSNIFQVMNFPFVFIYQPMSLRFLFFWHLLKILSVGYNSVCILCNYIVSNDFILSHTSRLFLQRGPEGMASKFMSPLPNLDQQCQCGFESNLVKCYLTCEGGNCLLIV